MPEAREPRIQRRAARVLLIDPDGRVLLFRGGDPARPEAGTWWFTPGGGLEDNESMTDAARREVHEETGVQLGAFDLNGPVFEQTIEFSFHGVLHEQYEKYFVARAEAFEVTSDLWTALEHDVMVEYRWWSVAEIEQSEEQIYPAALAQLVTRALAS